MFENYKDIVSVDDLKEMLGIGKSSAYALLKNKEIKHVKVGKKYIIPKQAVIGFINSMCYNGEQMSNSRLQLV
jgi:excisionase family DNA binding protein